MANQKHLVGADAKKDNGSKDQKNRVRVITQQSISYEIFKSHIGK